MMDKYIDEEAYIEASFNNEGAKKYLLGFFISGIDKFYKFAAYAIGHV